MDFRAGSIHSRSNPSNAGTEHLVRIAFEGDKDDALGLVRALVDDHESGRGGAAIKEERAAQRRIRLTMAVRQFYCVWVTAQAPHGQDPGERTDGEQGEGEGPTTQPNGIGHEVNGQQRQ